MESARTAFDAGAWQQAREDYLAIATEQSDPAAYEAAAQAAWWLDDASTCLGSRENAYRLFRQRGDDRGAARAAISLSYDSVLFGAGQAVGLGWLSRARALLEPLDEAEEHGWCEIRAAELALSVQHDPVRALAAADRAAQIAVRVGQPDLGVVALALQGLSLTQAGDIETGMPRLDAAVAAATTGEIPDAMWMGKVCCWLIAACDETQDVTRAAEWCRRVESVCADQHLVPLFNVCRIQYASVQVARGTWDEAERELIAVLDRLSGSRRNSRVEAVVQLGELRRRQGRTDEADALFAQAEFHPTAVAGRALIRLSNDDAAAAWTSISALLRTLPDQNLLVRAPFLLPAVRAATAAGDEAAAGVAADELRRTAHATGTDALMGLSAVADAVLAGPEDAVPLLREAVRRFGNAGLRHDQAEARLALAEALRDEGDLVGCHEQLDAVMPELDELSAAAGIESARRIRDSLVAPSTGPLTPREIEVLRLVSQGLSNQGIAEQLVLSEHTVHRHVANILTKLGQPTRAAAVAYALGAGIL